ncbi:MAG: hypothetical protein ACT6R7_15540 [Brevundimonas aurantiaca]|uniref:hypothetical protein n=1 Tax=Brevundimonas aurantiaca TaxID=74316 RepID=UPI004034628B
MDIAGGLYRELCETPAWDAVFGSGGRAASALAGVSPTVRLHAYVSQGPTSDAVRRLREIGVEVLEQSRTTEIAFSYLHPLSDPHIEPALEAIPQAQPLHIRADTILRFGFLEGDAVVDAGTAVFDPQTARRQMSFRQNGSRADRLALVLNEGELRAHGGEGGLDNVARAVMAGEAADVLILKRGAHGAAVYEGKAEPCQVPAYRSNAVFKIGTGDVFSAWFAHLWAERGLAADVAADQASRAVAAYAETRSLPPPQRNFPPLRLSADRGRILILGSPSTLGRRFVLEEARHRLRAMGVEVACPGLGDPAVAPGATTAVLVVAEALQQPLDDPFTAHPGTSVVTLDETGATVPSPGRDVCADFTTAIYRTAWAALGDKRTG